MSSLVTVTSHECHSTSDHWQLECLFYSWFRHSTKKTSKLCITGPLLGPLVDSPHKGPEKQEVFPCHDILLSEFSVVLHIFKQLRSPKCILPLLSIASLSWISISNSSSDGETLLIFFFHFFLNIFFSYFRTLCLRLWEWNKVCSCSILQDYFKTFLLKTESWALNLQCSQPGEKIVCLQLLGKNSLFVISWGRWPLPLTRFNP